MSPPLPHPHTRTPPSKKKAQNEFYVDSGIMTFVNHGCNGTNNIAGPDEMSLVDGDLPTVNEETADISEGGGREFLRISPAFDPARERHLRHSAVGADCAVRDIRAGEELFQNYLYFVSEPCEWSHYITDLRAQCRGESVGTIVAAEEDDDDDDDDNDDE